ncbi:MAG: hypothetical protein R3B47_04315 [Bacteroidia bacterium]
MHIRLLNRLAEVVPADCQITIVGDGEYDGCDWQARIKELGWHYVLRTGVGRLIERRRRAGQTGAFSPEPPEEICLA